MGARKEKRRKQGSLRARSWIYGALNPLLDGVRRERAQLAAGRAGLSPHTGRLDGVGAPPSYLSPEGQIVLEDLLRALSARGESWGPELSRRLAEHARAVAQVAEAAAAYHAALLDDPQLHALLREALGRYRSSASGPEEPWGAQRGELLPSLIAAHLVNGEAELPPHLPESALYRQLDDLRRALPVRPSRAQRDLLHARLAAAAADGATLIERLVELRFALCEAYDVPAAPVAGL